MNGKICASMIWIDLLLLTAVARPISAIEFVFLEAEAFDDCGGWVIDQQSMDQMGSPYLMAHGLGMPVKDAVTVKRIQKLGAYRVWVRTRDWVGPWKGPEMTRAMRAEGYLRPMELHPGAGAIGISRVSMGSRV